MPHVRLLVGTRKGGFIISAGADRRRWEVAGPFFEGWEVFHVQASSADPDRPYASAWTAWYGQAVHRSTDGGRTWHAVSNRFDYDPPAEPLESPPARHPRWKFKRVWHLAPVPAGSGSTNAPAADQETLFAGVEDAALFRSDDAGHSWTELSPLRLHPSRHLWEPGNGGLCLHTILSDPSNPRRVYAAISAAGPFRSDDGGQSWRPINRGLPSPHMAEEQPEAGHCVHKMALHPSRPWVLFQQNHWGVWRSDDAGESWRSIGEGLPSTFGFPIAVHAHEPDTIYVVPMTDDERHYPIGGALAVWRSRDGGGSWQPLGRGLPDRHCYVDVLRDGLAVDGLDPCGVYVGATGGQVYASRDSGDTWDAVALHLPAVLSVEAQTLP